MDCAVEAVYRHMFCNIIYYRFLACVSDYLLNHFYMRVTSITTAATYRTVLLQLLLLLLKLLLLCGWLGLKHQLTN